MQISLLLLEDYAIIFCVCDRFEVTRQKIMLYKEEQV